MKVATAILLGAGLLAMAFSPMAASAQQFGYGEAQHYDERSDAHDYGVTSSHGRYGQRDGDRGYAGERAYGGRDGEGGYDGRYQGEGYGAEGYRGGGYRGGESYGYRYGGYGGGYGHGRAYSDYAYEPAYGYEGAPYDNSGYDQYSGFVAPPVYGEDYGEPYYSHSYGRCGCRY